jgi:hypothetical protein
VVVCLSRGRSVPPKVVVVVAPMKCTRAQRSYSGKSEVCPANALKPTANSSAESIPPPEVLDRTSALEFHPDTNKGQASYSGQKLTPKKVKPITADKNKSATIVVGDKYKYNIQYEHKDQ